MDTIVSDTPLVPSSRKQTWQIGLLCTALFLVLYSFTVAPTIGMGHDTGELTTCCIIQGVPHSPGYPLFVALGWLAAQLPLGTDPAYRINLLCAWELALGMGFLGAALAQASRPTSALIATLLVGTCSAVWRQAVVTEVFALHLLFLAMLLWMAMLWENGSDARRRELLLATSFILGCCLAHQHIIALAAPPFLLFGLLAKGKKRRWGFSWLCLPILLAAMILPYWLQAYFASQKPALNWNDPETFSSLKDHFLRRSYGTGLLNEAALQFDSRAGGGQASAYFISLARSYFPFPSFLLILLGVDRAIQKGPSSKFWLFLGIFLVYGPLFAVLGNQPGLEFYSDMMERFYSSSILGLGGLAALGLDWLRQKLPQEQIRYLPFLLILPAYSLFLNYPKSSQRGQYQALDLMQAIYRFLPPRSALVVNGDLPAGASHYVRLVLHQRPDVITILPGLAGADWYQDTLPAGLALAGRRKPEEPLSHQLSLRKMVEYLEHRGYSVWTNEPPEGMPNSFVHVGLVQRYLPEKARKWTEDELIGEEERAFQSLEASPRRGDYKTDWRQSFWFRYCISKWIEAYRTIALGLVGRKPETALQALNRVLEMEYPPRAESYVNRANLELQLKRYDDAIRDYRTALTILPQSRMVLEGLIQSLDATHQKDEAERYRRDLSQLPQP